MNKKKFLFKQLPEKLQQRILEKIDFIVVYKTQRDKWKMEEKKKFFENWIFEINQKSTTKLKWRKYFWYSVHRRIDRYRQELGLPPLGVDIHT